MLGEETDLLFKLDDYILMPFHALLFLSDSRSRCVYRRDVQMNCQTDDHSISLPPLGPKSLGF